MDETILEYLSKQICYTKILSKGGFYMYKLVGYEEIKGKPVVKTLWPEQNVPTSSRGKSNKDQKEMGTS